MNAIKLRCGQCGFESELRNTYSCPCCGYSLEVIYDYSQVNVSFLTEVLQTPGSLWQYHELLPIRDKQNIISLGEGNTSLIQSDAIGRRLGVQLLFKDETRNPTCAFKDRPNTVGISVAKEMGIDTVTIASTGNAGASLSAYAAKSGLRCVVFIPAATSLNKVGQAIVHGATLVKVNGHYSNAFTLAKAAAEKYNWANITSTYLNPYTLEGDKTVAYELYRQMNGEVPDWIVVPLGAGALLTGIYKGFLELKLFGLIEKLPKMVGVQAENCAPITKAFEQGRDTAEAWGDPHTIASAIADPLIGYASDGTRTLRSINKSGGAGVSVSDTLILEYVRQLAQEEGIFAEPASAASVAAVDKLLKRQVIKSGDSVVALITGHGLKQSEIALEFADELIIVEPNLLSLEASLGFR